MPGLDVALQHERRPAYSVYAENCIRYVNEECCKKRILKEQAVTEIYVDYPGPLCLWEEVTDGWNGRGDYEEEEGKRKRRKVNYRDRSGLYPQEPKRCAVSAKLWLGDPQFYNFWQLEGHRKGCAVCARHWATGLFTVFFSLECKFIQKDCVSDSFGVDILRFRRARQLEQARRLLSATTGSHRRSVGLRMRSSCYASAS